MFQTILHCLFRNIKLTDRAGGDYYSSRDGEQMLVKIALEMKFPRRILRLFFLRERWVLEFNSLYSTVN